MRLFGLSLFAVALAFAAPAHAQQSACVTIENDAQRLACYDTANGRTPRATPSLPQTAAPEHHNPIPNLFGSTDTSRPAVDYEVAGISRGGDGVAYIAMTNREIWAVQGRPQHLPSAGAHVSIQRQRVGLYVLSFDGGDPFEVRKQN